MSGGLVVALFVALAALAQSTRLDVFRLLVKSSPPMT